MCHHSAQRKLCKKYNLNKLWYFHHFLGKNPFGYSSQNLGSLYKGIQKDMSKSFRHLVKTKHTHHPADDAIGHAEALLAMIEQDNLKIKLQQ
jgi:hypothetical protein